MVISCTFSPSRGDRVWWHAETNYGHSAPCRPGSIASKSYAETNYGHFAPCVNQEERIRQYQDDVGRSMLIIFKTLQVPLAGRFTGRMVFRSNEINVLSLLPFHLQ